MQLTKELLTQEISVVENRLETAKAQVHNIAGALSTLKDLLVFLEKEAEVVVEEVKTAISPENAIIQAADQAAQAEPTPVPPVKEEVQV